MDRVPPHDIEAERACLGALLLGDSDALTAVAERVAPADFYRSAHTKIAEAAFHLMPGSSVDLITVSAELKRRGWLEEVGGQAHLSTLMDYVVTTAGVHGYAQIVAHKARCRRAIQKLQVAQQSLYTAEPEELEDLQRRVALAVEDGPSRDYADVQLLGSVAVQDVATMLGRKPGALLGDTWGFKALDEVTNGLERSKLYIIAGRPAMGKTAFALEVARKNAAITKKPWLIVSYEMVVQDLAQRGVISAAGIEGAGYRKSSLAPDAWERAMQAAARLQAIPLYATDSCRSVSDIRRRAEWLQRTQGTLGGVLVDYLQLVKGQRHKGDSRVQEVSDISRDLKYMAMDLACPLVALSQLSRSVETRENKRPVLSDLRESGQIEQDAEMVAFLYRDAYYNPPSNPIPGAIETLEVIIAKQRNGPTPTAELAFKKEWGRFADWERRHEQE